MLALREYNRGKEDTANANELIAANVRALQLMWAGKGADKKIAEPKFSERFVIKDFEKPLEEPKTSTREAIPFWADDAKLEEMIDAPLPADVWNDAYTSLSGGLVINNG